MASIPADFRDLVGAPHFAHLATINADGSPQSSPIWVKLDGDDVLFATDLRYRKAQNMQRDPRVSMSIQDEANPYRYLELRGTAEMTPRDDWSFVDERTQAYMNVPEYPDKRDDSQGVIVRVKLAKVVSSNFQAPPDQPHPADISDLLSPPHFGHIATINPNGFPQTSPVWIKREGDDVVFWTSAETRKAQNLIRNPAIAVSARDITNPYTYVEVRGTATLDHVGADYSLLDDLARAYWQVPEYPDKSDDAQGVVVRIKVHHRVGQE
jgi:PPOX class probable F420-dependent enzyme